MKSIFTTLVLVLVFGYTFAQTDSTGTDTSATYIYATAQIMHESAQGAMDGAIDLTIEQGVAPYQLMWSNGQISQDIMNLAAGVYTVDIWDSEGANGTFSFEVLLMNDSTQNDSIPNDSTDCSNFYGYTNVTNVSEQGAYDGSVDLTVVGGAAPFAYSWNNGAVTEDIFNLTEGQYSVVVVDGNGCEFSVGAYVGTDSISNDSIPNDSIDCSNFYAYTYETFVSEQGAYDGSIDLTVVGGTAPFVYTWSNGAITEDLFNIGEGQYGVVVVDANGCEFTTGTYIGVNDSINNDSIPDDPCFGFYAYTYETYVSQQGATDGSIDLTVVGGTAPYIYSWNTGETTEDLYNLAEGYYSVVVEDAEGCSYTTSSYIYAAVDDSSNWENPVDTFDIQEPIDSCLEALYLDNVVINSYQVFDNTIAVVWNLYDANGNLIAIFEVSYDGTINVAGVYQFNLAIVPCDDTTNRSIQTINIYTAQVYIDPAVATGVQDIDKASNITLEVYPNPVKDIATISMQSEESTSTQIQVISTNGRILMNEVKELTYGENIMKFNTSDLGKGVYLVRVQTGNEVTVTRFVK